PGQDLFLVMIPCRRIDLHLTNGSTRHQHRNLSLQLYRLLCHASPFTQRLPRPSDLILDNSAGSKRDLTLPSPVVTTGRAFAKASPAQRRHGLSQLIERPHCTILPHRKPVSPKPIFLFNPVLNHREHSPARPHWGIARCRFHTSWRNLLDLQRYNIASTRKIRRLPRVIP